jgi:hypothetical protein
MSATSGASSEFKQQIQDARRCAQELISGLTPDQLTFRPDPTKWSIAECIAHLNVTASVVQPKVVDAIQQGRRDKVAGKGPFMLGGKGRLLIWFAEPPPKLRIRAPKHIAPPQQIDDPLQLLPEFLKAQDGWERLMQDCEGLDLGKLKVGQPFSLFRTRLSATIPWMLAHQRRHLWQAENVKKQLQAKAALAAD